MLLWILVAVCLILLTWILSRPFYWAGKGIKYITPWPLVGNAKTFLEGGVKFGEELYKKFPEEKLFGFHLFTTPVLLVRDPDLIVEIAIKDSDHFMDNSLGSNQEHDMTGGNLLFLTGQQWKEVRSKVSPFFTPSKVKAMLASVDVTMPKSFKVLDELIRTGEPCNQGEILGQIVNDVITQAVFGIESDVFEKNSQFKPLAEIFFSPKTNMMFTIRNISQSLFKFLRLQSFDTSGALFVKRIVQDLVNYRKANNVHGQDFVQGMIEIMEKYGKESNGKIEYYPDGTRVPKFDFEEMFLHEFIIFLGGIESTATAMIWMFYELAMNQEIQEKCRDEVMSIVENKNRHVTLDDLSELPYIVATVKEAVRMYPPFMMMGRKSTKRYTFKEFKDLTIEPGQLILIASQAMQRDPQYFRDPDTFDPDRFIDAEEPRSGVITSFGLGPKMCIGKSFANNEMILIVSRLLQKYRFTMNPKTEVPLVPNKYRPVNSPEKPLWLNVTHV